MLSGLGFTGKNCRTIHPERGSFLLLGTLCVPEVFEYDVGWHGRDLVDELQVLDGLAPGTRVGRWEIRLEDVRRVGTCGGCVRCLSACPTDAFVGPLHLDARRCISYWTIESRGVILAVFAISFWQSDFWL
ncbi:MAG: 4Fe-4S double cluster binding domain-containing protein [Caldilineaceae bacterium]